MNHHRKKLFDDNGVLVKENDIVKIYKTIGQGTISLIARYDEKNQRWLFYSGAVAYTWEHLKSFPAVKSIIVACNSDKNEKS
jgi:hypothetical protein